MLNTDREIGIAIPPFYGDTSGCDLSDVTDKDNDITDCGVEILSSLEAKYKLHE